MTQKRFRKLCMANGISRNIVNRLCVMASARQSYSGMYEDMTLTPESSVVKVMQEKAHAKWDRADIRHYTRLMHDGKLTPPWARKSDE